MAALIAIFYFLHVVFTKGTITLGGSTPCRVHNETHFLATVGFTINKDPPKKFYATIFHPQCTVNEEVCPKKVFEETDLRGRTYIVDCRKPYNTSALTTSSFVTYIPMEVGIYESHRYVALHEKPDVCAWGVTTMSEARLQFLSYGEISCSYTQSNSMSTFWRYIGLVLITVIPFVFLCVLIKTLWVRILANIRNSNGDNNTISSDNNNNNVPLYDIGNASYPQTENQFQLFPEYPMMYNNPQIGNSQIINMVDPTQSLTPVYTQTYAQPGVQ